MCAAQCRASPGSCMSCVHMLECVDRTLTTNHHSFDLRGEYMSGIYWRSVECQIGQHAAMCRGVVTALWPKCLLVQVHVM